MNAAAPILAPAPAEPIRLPLRWAGRLGRGHLVCAADGSQVAIFTGGGSDALAAAAAGEAIATLNGHPQLLDALAATFAALESLVAAGAVADRRSVDLGELGARSLKRIIADAHAALAARV